MSFRTWLRSQRDRDDPVGDLAQDFERDGETKGRAFRSVGGFIEYLEAQGACDGAIEAAKSAWKEYERRGEVI